MMPNVHLHAVIIVCSSYPLDLGSETQLRNQIQQLLFVDSYLSKVIDDKKSWFTWIEVLDLIYHQLLFTADTLG